jgi:hypothetical protein
MLHKMETKINISIHIYKIFLDNYVLLIRGD